MSIDMILASIRRWEADSTQQERERVRFVIAGEIRPFLGEQATQRILVALANDYSRLLCTVEDVLRTFLGSQAASAVVTRAMNRATVRS